MKCPFCLSIRMKVVDKRNLEEINGIRRRRECLSCGRRFTTYERIELSALSVIKKDGRRESFNRQKLIAGIQKACEKRPVSLAKVEELAHSLEAELRNSGEREIPSHIIGALVMEKLKSLDQVAYIRFASVYREFRDLRSFERELKTLKKS